MRDVAKLTTILPRQLCERSGDAARYRALGSAGKTAKPARAAAQDLVALVLTGPGAAIILKGSK